MDQFSDFLPSHSVILTGGIPGCGKSYYARMLSQRYAIPIISPDDIRQHLLGDATNQLFNPLIWKVAKAMAETCLAADRSLIIDAMYIEPEYRQQDTAGFRSWGAQKIYGVVFTTPLEVCQARNARRDRHIAPTVIADLYSQLQLHPPTLDEGFDQIILISGEI